MTDELGNDCERVARVMATTPLTDAGAALFRLLTYGMISPLDARHLVEDDLAEPDWINIELGTPRPEIFHLIALTAEGTAAAEKIEQRMVPLPGLCGSQQIEGDTSGCDGPWVMTRDTFWRHLSAMKASIATDWQSHDQPKMPTQSDPLSMGSVNQTRRKGKHRKFEISPETYALLRNDEADPDQPPEDT